MPKKKMEIQGVDGKKVIIEADYKKESEPKSEYEKDAEKIFEVLLNALPSRTFDCLCEMFADYDAR